MVRNYVRKTTDRWSKEDLLEALLCIKEAKLKINDASRQYGISRATLYRHYEKFMMAGGKCDVEQFRTCGGNPILTKVEENVLEKTVMDLRKQGSTITSGDIKRICFEYCDVNRIPNQFNREKRMASDDWYYGYLRRHPNVKLPSRPVRTSRRIPTWSLSGASTSTAMISANGIAAALSAAVPLKKSLKRLGGKGTAKRNAKNENEVQDIEEDASVEDMEDDAEQDVTMEVDAEQDDTMEVDGEDSEGNEDEESGAEEEEEDDVEEGEEDGEEVDEEEEGDETGEVEEDDVGEDEEEEEETDVGEEDEQEEEGENEEENEEGQDEEKTAEEQEGMENEEELE